MSRENPAPPAAKNNGVHGPRYGRTSIAAHRPPCAGQLKAKALMCRSPVRSVRASRTTSDPSILRQQQRHMDRLSKKMGTINLASPIRKQGGHLRAQTSQGFAAQQERAQESTRIVPFQRKPAHIRAMEDSRKPALRPPLAAKPTVTAVSIHEAAELMARARSSVGELRTQLSALAASTNFNLLDKIVAHRGEDALEALRHAFEELNKLATSFNHVIAVPGNANSNQRTSSMVEGSKSNCIQIKSSVVSLRAICDRLVQQPIDVDAASRIVRIVEQGLVEQLLSWASECESAYEVLVPEKRAVCKGLQQPHAVVEQQRPANTLSSRVCSGTQTGRSRKIFIVQPRRDSAGGLVSARADRAGTPPRTDSAGTGGHSQRFRHPSPPVDPCPSSAAPFTYSSAPRACKTIAERRERLQRHRPPMLIIPH